MSDFPEIDDWRRRGRLLDDDPRLFVVDAGDATDPTIVVLHGYPSSSFDYHRVIDTLAERHRVVIHDHLGFGLSPKPRNGPYGLKDQGDRALAVWRELGVERAHLVAHDYGTSVATELLARRERGELDVELQSVVLCNGSVHIELASMSIIQRLVPKPIVGDILARLARYPLFRRQIRRILGRNEAVDDREIELMWELLTRDGGRAALPRIARYVEERRTFFDEWVGAWSRCDLPSLILWGKEDAVAIPAIAEALAADNHDADLVWLDGLGHYPMLEGPEEWAEPLLGFVRSHQTSRHARNSDGRT